MVVVPFVLAVAFRHGGGCSRAPDLYLGAVGIVPGFVIGCPFFLSEFNLFLDQVADDIYTYAYAGREGAEGVDNWASHADLHLALRRGLGRRLAGVAGLGLVLYRMNAGARGVPELPDPVLRLLQHAAHQLPRPTSSPSIPFLAVLAAYAVVELLAGCGAAPRPTAHARAPRSPRRRCSSLMLVPPLRTAVRYNVEVTRRDTGNEAREWIDAHVPARDALRGRAPHAGARPQAVQGRPGVAARSPAA